MKQVLRQVLILLVLGFFSLLGSPATWADLAPGQVLGQNNWQEAQGLLPDSVLQRFQNGNYRATITTLQEALSWGSTFNAASEANAGKFSVNADDFLIDTATHSYPTFLYGYPFPQVAPDDPQAAAKVMYNFSYALMQADDATRFSNLYWVSPAELERDVEFEVRLLFLGSRLSGPPANPDAALRKMLVAGIEPPVVKGTLILEWVHLDPEKWNSLWSYLPEIRRVKRLPAFKGSDTLFGSDIAHDDPFLFSGKVQYFTWKLVAAQAALVPYRLSKPVRRLRQEDTGYVLERSKDPLVMGWTATHRTGNAWWPQNYGLVKRPVWVLEGTAKDPKYAYSRQVLWIDQELYLGYYKETYDRAGQLWRSLLNSVSIGKSDAGDFSVLQPDMTLSVDEQLNRATVELPLKQGQKLTVNEGLTDDLFTPTGIGRRGR